MAVAKNWPDHTGMDKNGSSTIATQIILGLVIAALVVGVTFSFAFASQSRWSALWPKTDFTRHSVPLDEVISGGPGKDGIPSIADTKFAPVSDFKGTDRLGPMEPVISFSHMGDKRAYPLRILMWHEIVNDVVGGVPVAVTYCPLCNSAIVFDRRVAGRVLEFGTTGNLRKSDMVMYDRQTESWWQQYTGTGIVGEMNKTVLKALPARVEAFSRFAKAAPGGKVLLAPEGVFRAYGVNPYEKYDSAERPFLFQGAMPKGIAPLAYVLVVGDEAWTLDLLRKKKRVESGDLVIEWSAGQNSALDVAEIIKGRDIGNVTVQRKSPGGLRDEVHDLTFAFVFNAFHPNGTLHK